MLPYKCSNTIHGRLLLPDSSKVMVIVAHGIEYIKGDIVIFTGSEEIPCPVCRKRLFVRGTCHRKLLTTDGIRQYRLRVMECSGCGHTHRELPNNMIPFKRMDVNLIAKIADADKHGHLKIAETSVWRRVLVWVSGFLWYAQNVQNGLKLNTSAFRTIEDGCTTADRLAYFVRLTVNSGNWIQHRSAQTYP